MPLILPSDHSHLAHFREMACQVTARPPLIQPLENITGVGAVYDSENGLSLRDSFWLLYTLKFCESVGIDLPRFHFTPIDKRSGLDFLDPVNDVPTDILMSCFVLDRDNETYSELSDLHQEPSFLTSPLHSKDAWREAALRVGARLIVTFNQVCEINTDHFCTDDGDYIQGPHAVVEAPKPDGHKMIYYMETAFRRDFMTSLREERIEARCRLG